VSRALKPSALKRLKETYGSKDLILPSLTRHVMRQQAEDQSRRTDHLHPSDMSHREWCHRHDYYRMVGQPMEKESKANPSFTMENLFAEGHSIHDKYQTWLWEMGVLYGEWYCHACGHTFFGLSPRVCVACDSKRLSYREVPLSRTGSVIEGHADGAVHDLDGFTGLIEIKSVGLGTLRFEAPRLLQQYEDDRLDLNMLWYRINRPFPSHIRQGQLYLWLSWPRYERIVYIYESKFNQRTKEFVVEYNPQVIAPLLEKAREVSQAVLSGTPPARPDWAEDAAVKICVSCPYRRHCWSMNGADTQTVPAPAGPVVRVNTNPTARRRSARDAAKRRAS
jgi:CRISPR/Cas system-associated exonuclease Cas4 (RecB family)